MQFKAIGRRVILHVAKRTGLFHITQQVFKKRLLILCYHGFELADEASFRPKLFMSPSVFNRRLELLKKYKKNVVGLSRAINDLRNGGSTKDSVCITIDDGFYSTLSIACKELQKFDFPATLYVTSYYVNNNVPIFNLAVQYIFWKTDVLRLSATDFAPGAIDIFDLAKSSERERAVQHILDMSSKGLERPERHRLLVRLGTLLNVDYDNVVESRILSLLSRSELSLLKQFGVDVQLHTHRHTSSDDKDRFLAEIRENAEVLEHFADSPLVHFCYPSGRWSQNHWPWLQELGVQSAVTCNPALNTRRTPSYALYRVVDENNISDIEFEAELAGFSEFIRLITGRRYRMAQARLGNLE